MLAVRQHDVGMVATHPFDPGVPVGTYSMPRPYPYDPERRAWIRKEMQAMCDADVLERTDDVRCAGGVVLVEG